MRNDDKISLDSVIRSVSCRMGKFVDVLPSPYASFFKTESFESFYPFPNICGRKMAHIFYAVTTIASIELDGRTCLPSSKFKTTVSLIRSAVDLGTSK